MPMSVSLFLAACSSMDQFSIMCLPEESGYSGYCTSELCCDYKTEEKCYDEDYMPTSCAKVRLRGHVWNSQI